MNPILLIPARMASTRLPGKPLADIGGRAHDRAGLGPGHGGRAGPVVVAAGEAEIVAAVEKAGGRAVLTDPGPALRLGPHLRGPDGGSIRKAPMTWWSICRATCRRWTPSRLKTVVAALAKSGADIATLAAPIDNEADRGNPAVVKAVVAWDAGEQIGPGALFHPRAPRPTGDGALYHHVGLYAYRREALESFVALPPSPLEEREKLEQLRALEAGMSIAVARVDSAPLSVDTPADLGKSPRRSCRDSSHLQKAKRIAFQGEPGAYANLAAREAVPHAQAIPKPTFEDAIEAAKSGDTDLVHHSGGKFADRPHRRHPSPVAGFGPAYRGRAFPAHPSSIAGPEGREPSKTSRASTARPRRWRNAATCLRDRKLAVHNWYDTAGSAKHVAELGDKSAAAIASSLAAEFYGLKILKADVEDEHHNMPPAS